MKNSKFKKALSVNIAIIASVVILIPLFFSGCGTKAAGEQGDLIPPGGIDVTLPGDDLEEIAKVEGFTKSENKTIEIDLSNKGITDAKLAEMVQSGEIPKDTTHLTLTNNEISDLTPLSALTSLTMLILESNKISDVTPLKNLTNLQVLSIKANQIKDISPLSALTNLAFLHCKNNQIKDITALKNMTKLQQVSFKNNQVSDLTPLASLTTLTYLGLGDNQVTDIRPLSALVNLTYLALDGNQLTDITALKSLTKLETISLSGTISDFSPIYKLTGLKELYIMGITLTQAQKDELAAALSGTMIAYY